MRRWIPPHSLRWRIAASYAVLLVAIIATVAVVLTFAFRSILLDQAHARVDRISADIVRIATRSDPLFIAGESGAIEAEITSPSNLEHWSSPTTYVQIDNTAGYPIGKSTNLGSVTLLPDRELTAANPTRYRIERTAAGPLLVVDRRVGPPEGPPLVIHVGESLELIEVTLARSRLLLAIVVVLSIPVVIVASSMLAGSAIRPIDDLTKAMREVGSGRLDRRLAWADRTDELGRLAQTFNAMLDRLEEAFARERQFISDASHELKTPLTVINANAQMLQRWADREPRIRAESLAAIVEESAALARMVNGMLMLAKADAGDAILKEPVVLARVVAETVRAAQPRAAAKRLELRFHDRQPDGYSAIVAGEANLLRQLFTNLIDNAIKFTEHGSIDISIRTAETEAPAVVVDVTDTGIGIEDASLARIFDRFYRTDKSRSRAVEGTGLGLAIVRSIADVHGGQVEALRDRGGGTTMRVTLPVISSGVLKADPADSVISPS